MENRTLLLPVQQRLRAAAAAAADDDDDIILGSMSCVYAWITKQKQIKKKKIGCGFLLQKLISQPAS